MFVSATRSTLSEKQHMALALTRNWERGDYRRARRIMSNCSSAGRYVTLFRLGGEASGRGDSLMFRARLLAAALAVASLPFASGCITLFSKTEVVRSEESPVHPSFESPQAEDTFR